MTDVVLVNPPWRMQSGNFWQRVRACYPPLGLLYLASTLEKDGRSVRILDSHAENLTEEQIAAIVKRDNPRVVGITATTVTANGAGQVATAIKRVLPDCTLVAGGVHPSGVPEDVLRNEAIDLVVRGEGERTLSRIVAGEPWSGIAGLAFRGEDGIVLTPPAPIVRDLDSLPPPAYHLIDFRRYHPAVGAYEQLPAMQVMSSRGCPGRCIFCNSADSVYRVRGPEAIIAEIDNLRATYGIREINFYDDTFAGSRRTLFGLCEHLIKTRAGISWSCFARTDLVDRETLSLMRRAGCHHILFGIESASPEILRRVGKKIAFDQIHRVIREAMELGIEVRISLMLGNVGETEETMEASVRLALELDPDIALFCIAVPYPGTEMFRWADTNGYLLSKNWDDYDLQRYLVRQPGLAPEAVERKEREAYRRFYLRAGYMLRRLKKLRKPSQLKAAAQAMASVLRF